MVERGMLLREGYWLFCMLFFFLSVSCQKEKMVFSDKESTKSIKAANNTGVIIEISPEQLHQLLKDDPNLLLIDIRTEAELSGDLPKLKQAVHIDKDVIYGNPDTIPKGKTIAIMCRSGHRSGKLARFLQDNGRIIYELKGGLKNYYEIKHEIKK